MRQDMDVARMAAALRTPSLKYRSFGNEAVRKDPAPLPPDQDRVLSILGEALALASELPPETVLGESPSAGSRHATRHGAGVASRQHAIPTPQDLPAQDIGHPPRHAPLLREVGRTPAAAGAVPPQGLPMAWQPPAPLRAPPATPAPLPTPPLHAAPIRPAPALPPAAPPPSATQALRPAAGYGEGGSTLLQVLLGAAPIGAGTGAPVARPVPPAWAATGMNPPAGSSYPDRPGTGSSLLDTLLGGAVEGAGIHYPLLDALQGLRGDAGEPFPRQWPAARVEIPLPELLRRVAAGLRVARSAA